MKAFKESLDQIKAEDVLKEKTKAFVGAAIKENKLEGDEKNSRLSAVKRAIQMKWLRFAAATATFCMVFAICGFAYYTPVSYLNLDISPSVELGLNAFDRIVRVNALNEDGNKLILDRKFSSMTVEKAIDTLVQLAADQGYIAEDGSTVVAVTAESKNDKKAAELAARGEAGVGLAMSSKNISSVTYKDCSDPSLRTEAKEEGISPGKLKLIKAMQQLNPDITVDEYKEAKVSEIITEADDLISKAPPMNEEEKLKGTVKNIKDTAQKMRDSKKETGKEIQSDEIKPKTKVNGLE